MLVFFIHGVATSDVKYAANLRTLLKEEFTKIDKPLPYFHSCFYGDVLNDVGKMWNWIHQDLQQIKKEDPQADIQDVFRYQQFRQGLMSDFVGDALTYLNSERGVRIRELIADHLDDFIKRNPQETDLHIVAHSMGSVILWDILFSDRFSSNDAAFKIRALVKGDSSTHEQNVYLRSITTMGSPILFFNMMLGFTSDKVKSFANSQKYSLRWINIIHSSDLLAYPLRASLNIDPSCHITFKDKYIYKDANSAERTVRDFINSAQKLINAVGQFNGAVKEALTHAPMLAGAGDGHTGYWNCRQTACLITANILEGIGTSLINDVIARLEQVDGMKPILIPDLRLHFLDQTLESLSFKDGSGSLCLVVNPLRIYHVYLFDEHEVIRFAKFVGLIHGKGLKKEVDFIKNNFC